MSEQDERETGERCQSCGERYTYVWTAPSDLWEKYSRGANLLCLPCFDRRMENDAFVRWVPILNEEAERYLPSLSLLAEGERTLQPEQVFQLASALEGRCNDLEAENRDLRRQFPMQHGPSIPWKLAEFIYAKYREVFPSVDQSLERIAERGGFGWSEVELMFSHHPKRYTDLYREAVEAADSRAESAERIARIAVTAIQHAVQTPAAAHTICVSALNVISDESGQQS